MLPMRFPERGFPAMRFTRSSVANFALVEGKGEAIVFDDAMPGFGLRIRAGGKRTWIAQYRVGSKQRRITIGSTDKVDLDEARRRAKTALGKVALGADPQSEKAEARAKASVTVGVVAERYLTGYAPGRLKPRSLHEVERHLRQHWRALAERPISSVKRADVAGQLGQIAKNSGPFAANRARAALSALFSWSIGEGLAEANPVAGTHRPTEEISRDRVLSDLELALVWRSGGSGDYGAIVQLLILTGCRRDEVGSMAWSEVDGDLWTIPEHRTKNGLPHDVPLTPAAEKLLAALHRRDGRDFVFGSRAGPFSGWSKAKAELDGRMLAAAKEQHGCDAKLLPWRLHDLRRTASTRMAELGVFPHVVEAVLNHVSGHKAGVAGVYNRAVYSEAKRAALDLWGAHVAKLVGERV